MVTIGILGGVASGKSLVAQILAEFGAGVLDADVAGHRVLSEPEVVAALVGEFGEAILDGSLDASLNAGGDVDRKAIAQHVFGETKAASANLRKLEAIVHPTIKAHLEAEAKEMAQDRALVAMVLDAPLLLEVGWDAMCDLLLFVDAPKKKRQEFAQQRGWTGDQLELRQQAQMDLDQKRDRADFVIANTGDQDDLRQTVRRFWDTHVVPKIAGG